MNCCMAVTSPLRIHWSARLPVLLRLSRCRASRTENPCEPNAGAAPKISPARIASSSANPAVAGSIETSGNPDGNSARDRLNTLIATAANLVVCFVAAYLIVFRQFAGRGLLELLVALPWAIPATAIALGLAATFNRNDLATGRILLVGTFWILPLAYFIRDTPLVASAVESSLRQMDASLEDAARGLGASWLMTMRRVILPAARPGLVAGGLLAAVTAVGEFVASVVLYTHSNRPISMEILAQLRALAFGTAAAYSVLLILLVLLMTLAARSFEERLA